MFIKYSVKIEQFAESHYIEKFQRKYKNAWAVTWKGIQEELMRIDSLLSTSIAEIIIERENYKIIKTEFRIAGTKESRKASGNRCIVLLNQDKEEIVILLVYNKNDLRDKNETAQWRKIIKENYKDYSNLF